jgi:hypothetical protein
MAGVVVLEKAVKDVVGQQLMDRLAIRLEPRPSFLMQYYVRDVLPNRRRTNGFGAYTVLS